MKQELSAGRRLDTPDYFVLRTDSIGWEEWKTEEGLARLAETMPHRYSRDTLGRWRCPPGERFAEPFGFFYRLRSSAEIDWVVQRNLRFLQDYLGLRGKELIIKLGRSRRYQLSPPGMRAITTLLVLRDRVIKPILAGAQTSTRPPKPTIFTPPTSTTNACALPFSLSSSI